MTTHKMQAPQPYAFFNRPLVGHPHPLDFSPRVFAYFCQRFMQGLVLAS